MGAEVLPLREADVREGAAELLDAGVEGICVCFLFSYRNAEHEIRSRRDRRRAEAPSAASTAEVPSISPPSSIRCAATCRGSTRP